MSKFIDFCKKEVEIAGLLDKEKDFYGGMTGKAVLELCNIFAKQGHSGMSASVVASIFHRLTKWEPISPLTGEDDEWQNIGCGLYQNKRCPSVFKEKDKAYQSDYYIFQEEDGTTFTSKESRRDITFPYYPGHEIIKVNNQQEKPCS